MIFLRSLDNECKAMLSAASRLPRSRLEKPRSREPSQPALSHELIKNFTKDLEVRWDLGNRASPVNRALACSDIHEEKENEGRLEGERGREFLRSLSPVTASLTGLMWRGQYIQKNTRPQLFKRCIHRINHYSLDSAVGFSNTYPLDTAVYPQGHPTSIFGK